MTSGETSGGERGEMGKNAAEMAALRNELDASDAAQGAEVAR